MEMERLLRYCSWLLLFASFLGFMGLSWDVQWHADVGPDSFFTIPHALIYSSSAIEGLVSLVVGILFTQYVRNNPDTDIEYRSFWGLKGPVGYILCGASAVVFIASGFYDLWWHTVYGFDVTLVSPSHFGLFFSSIIGKIGLLYIFASASIRAKRQNQPRLLLWNHVGFALGMSALFLSLSPFLMIALSQLSMMRIFIGYPMFATIFFTTGLAAVAVFTNRPGMAACSAAYLSIVKLIAVVTTPGMVAWLARQEDFIYKHDAVIVPLISTSLPLWIVVMGVFIDLWKYSKKFISQPRLHAAAGGSLAALLLFVLDPRWKVFYRNTHQGVIKASVSSAFDHGWWPTLSLVVLLGALCAIIGLKAGESFLYANHNYKMSKAGNRKTISGTLSVLIILVLGLSVSKPGPVFAHEESLDQSLTQVARINAGAYGLTVWANEYPIPARKSLQVRIVPEGGIDGLKGTYRLMLPGTSQREFRGSLYPYPGVKDAWVVDLAGIPAEGEWDWEFTIQGSKGTAKTSLNHFLVTSPPGIPMWAGWIVGLFPLYGLIGFMISEVYRIRWLKRHISSDIP